MSSRGQSRALIDIPGQSEFVHFHGKLEKPIQTLTLRLRFGGSITPDVAEIG